MARVYFTILILTVWLAASGCGQSSAQKGESSPTPERAANINSNVVYRSNAETNAGALSGTNQGSFPRVNSAVRPIISSNINSRVSNDGPAGVEEPSSSNTGIERNVSRRRERIDADPTATPPPPTFQAAAENSEFAVQMERGGNIVETRIFKRHAQLKKVEIRWADPQSRSLKVTLKNGKIVERQSVPIVNLRTVSSAELLKLAGIKAVQ